MIRRLLARWRQPDPEALLAELGHAAQPNYAAMDRYADFRAVFLGSEQGKRVLHEVLSWGHVYRVSAPSQPVDPYRMAFNEGERNLALKLLATVNHEPAGRPAQTNSKRST